MADALKFGAASNRTRARIVSEPVTEYIRFDHAITASALRVGEEVRATGGRTRTGRRTARCEAGGRPPAVRIQTCAPHTAAVTRQRMLREILSAAHELAKDGPPEGQKWAWTPVVHRLPLPA
ncbi:DUF6879 family protein [Streptomyces lydicus]|uniref:DUF6879 family protein n=1 Tax=Streptomyces lydicus TaxID=47763 RepID=UPI0037A2AE9E